MATIPILPTGHPGRSDATESHKSSRRRLCPHCSSDEIYRQRARGIIERHFARAIHFFPFWCAACDRRFYVRELSSHPL
jgi:hypothetical protein